MLLSLLLPLAPKVAAHAVAHVVWGGSRRCRLLMLVPSVLLEVAAGVNELAAVRAGQVNSVRPVLAHSLQTEEIIKIIFHIVIMRKAQISTHFYISFSL